MDGSANPFTYELLVGDCGDSLSLCVEDETVQACVTSPPYWGLRDYNVDGQIGLEASFDEWLTKMVGVFREVRRVLRPDGVAWVNMGDSYAGSGRGGDTGTSGLQGSTEGQEQSKLARGVTSAAQRANCPAVQGDRRRGFKPKDLIGQPWRLAFALQADGWYLRQDIIWHKPNPMPESISDRCTKAHEYIFLLAKSPRYYFDKAAIAEPASKNSHARKAIFPAGWATGPGSHAAAADYQTAKNHRKVTKPGVHPKTAPARSGIKANESFSAAVSDLVEKRNKRSVWTITPRPYKQAHFATFPVELPETCIKASTRPGDLVLDPFGGAGTTGLAAKNLGRRALLCELNPEYAELIRARLA